jgi:hypothetical protein
LDVDDVDETSLEIAMEYQVSQQLVLNHLANRDLIDASLWGDPHFKPQGILFTISDDDSARPSSACSRMNSQLC